MTVKERIFTALNGIGLPVAYRDSDVNVMPRISYSLVSHNAIKLSNAKHTKKMRYQIDFFDRMARDVESDEYLLRAQEELLKQGLNCTEWTELSSINAEMETGLYHYTMDVFGS